MPAGGAPGPGGDHSGRDGGGCRRWPGSGGGCGRRNGTRRPRLPCEPGNIKPGMPGTRRYRPTARAREICAPRPGGDRVIPAGFVPGLSLRRVGEVPPPLLGRAVPPATVGRIAGTLDAVGTAFHRRRIANRYKAPMPDGVVPTRRTGADATSNVPCRSRPTSSLAGARGSSTSNPPAAKAPPNGSTRPPPSTGTILPIRASR